MSVGVLLVTHQDIGAILLDTARSMLATLSLSTDSLAVPEDANCEKLTLAGNTLARKLDCGDGVLIFSDIYGSTPSNIAEKIHVANGSIVVSGLNLPMLVRIFNYPELNLSDLADKALSGGHNGIVLCHEAKLDD